MAFMLWVIGAAICEYHAHPHVAHGLFHCQGGHQHMVCRGCVEEMAAKNRRDEYHERQERARWN